MGGERVETTGQEQEDPAIGMARACAAGLDSCKNTRLPPATKSGETEEPPRPEGRDRIAGAERLLAKQNARRFESVVATKMAEFVVPRVTTQQLGFVTSCSVPEKAIQWEDRQFIRS